MVLRSSTKLGWWQGQGMHCGVWIDVGPQQNQIVGLGSFGLYLRWIVFAWRAVPFLTDWFFRGVLLFAVIGRLGIFYFSLTFLGLWDKRFCCHLGIDTVGQVMLSLNSFIVASWVCCKLISSSSRHHHVCLLEHSPL